MNGKFAIMMLPAKLMRYALVLILLLCGTTGPGFSAEVDPLDWPNWRGPQQNRVSMEKGLIESWDPKGGEGSNLLWKNDKLAGRSSPIVLRGKLYTIVRDQPETENEGEKVVCADAATGDILWEADLPFGGNATPSTYMVDGRQYVVISAGGAKSGRPAGGVIVAFTLPE